MLEFFLNLDTALTNSITTILPRNTVLDYFFLFFSFNWLTVVIAAVLFILFLHAESKQTKQFVIYFLISFLTISFLVEIVIKNIIQRDRPYITNQVETLYCPETFSFPSGHASVAFAGAVLFSYFDKKRKWLYYTVASLIALSRVYLDCHYFSDIFFGAFFGYITSKVLLLYITDR